MDGISSALSAAQSQSTQGGIILSLLKSIDNLAQATTVKLVDQTVNQLAQMQLASLGIGKNFSGQA